MGVVKVRARVGPDTDHLHEVEFMADTGAFYTVLSPEFCERTGIRTPLREQVTTADNRAITSEGGLAHIEIDGRSAGIMVGKLEAPEPLLGVSALEALGFKVNPVDGALGQTRPYLEIPLL